MKKALIFKTGELETDKYLLEKLNTFAKNTKFTLNHYKSLKVIMPGTGAKDIKVYVDDIDILNYDLVYFKSWRKVQPLATALAYFLKSNSKKFIDTAVSLPTYGNKVSQTMILQLNNLNSPKTIYLSADSVEINAKFIIEELRLPLIMKSVGGSNGDDNYKINNENELIENMRKDTSIDYVFQEFIPNDFDYRIFVVGGKVSAVEKRIRNNNETHLNNPAKGAIEEYIDIESAPNEVKDMAIKAAELFKREIAGVDVLPSSDTNKHYILEVNPSPGLTYDENETTEINALANYLDNL